MLSASPAQKNHLLATICSTLPCPPKRQYLSSADCLEDNIISTTAVAWHDSSLKMTSRVDVWDVKLC